MKNKIISLISIVFFMFLTNFSLSAGELFWEDETDYFWSDIFVEVVDLGDNTAGIYIVNESEGPIYIGSDSLLYSCDNDGNIIEVADSYADKLTKIDPGKNYSYSTGVLYDGYLFAYEIIAVDFYGNPYSWYGLFGYYN